MFEQVVDTEGNKLSPVRDILHLDINTEGSYFSASADGNGNVYLAWASNSIYVQKINATGAPVGAMVAIDTVITGGPPPFPGSYFAPAISTLSDGSVVVSWLGASDYSIHTRVLNGDLQPLTSVASVDPFIQPARALPDFDQYVFPPVNCFFEPAQSGIPAYTVTSEVKGMSPIPVDQGTVLTSLAGQTYPSTQYVTIPTTFPFSFFNKTPVDSVTIFPNGVIRVGSYPTWCGPYTDLAHASSLQSMMDNVIAPFWANVDVSSSGKVAYQITGSAPSRVLTIEWDHLTRSYDGADVTCQVKLYETSNNVRFCYHLLSSVNTTSGFSVGMQDTLNQGNIIPIFASPSLTRADDGSVLLGRSGYAFDDPVGYQEYVHRMRPGALAWEPRTTLREESWATPQSCPMISSAPGGRLALSWTSLRGDTLSCRFYDTTWTPVSGRFLVGYDLTTDDTYPNHSALVTRSGKYLLEYANVLGHRVAVFNSTDDSSPHTLDPAAALTDNTYILPSHGRNLSIYEDGSGTLLVERTAGNSMVPSDVWLKTLNAETVLVRDVRLNTNLIPVERPDVAPTVIVDSAGNITVLWSSGTRYPYDSSIPWEGGISARKYDSNGMALTDQVAVTASATSPPRAAVSPDGSLFFVWTDHDTLFGRRYTALLTPVGDPVRLNTVAGADWYSLSVTTNAIGRTIVSWSNSGDGSIRIRALDENGQPMGSSEQVIASIGSGSRTQIVSLSDGRFLLGFGAGTTQLQWFDRTCAASGTLFTMPFPAWFFRLAAMPAGGFALLYGNYDSYAHFKIFDADAVDKGVDNLVYVGFNIDIMASFTSDTTGRIVILSQSPYDNYNSAPVCQVYNKDGVKFEEDLIRTSSASPNPQYLSAQICGDRVVAAWGSLDYTSAQNIWLNITKVHQITSSSVAVTVHPRWNLVSLPVVAPSDSVSTVFTMAGTAAYSFSEASGYLPQSVLEPQRGYWIKFPTEETVILTGSPVVQATVHVSAGWNLIGGLSYPLPVQSISVSSGSMTLSPFYGYRSGYVTSDTLQPGQGYWIKASIEGNLYLGGAAAASRTFRPQIIKPGDLPPAPPEEAQASGSTIPTSYGLAQNYPNPFNPTTDIGYRIADPGLVALKVYNMLGQEVSTLVNEVKTPGEYTARWNAGNNPSGIYFYKLTARNYTEVRKMALAR